MKPTLVVNPGADRVFAAFAAVLVDDGVSSTVELERRLRPIYPNAIVHRRELASESMLIWYVYRDGRWVDPRAEAARVEGATPNARSDRGPSIDPGVDPGGRGNREGYGAREDRARSQ